jgi:cation diffusion facilitator CzcD-associated flavoprotein CzcO
MAQKPTVAIIGAGFSGVGMAIKLKEAGYDQITVFDKAPKVGGTWYWNTYPGCACDVPIQLYSYSFAPSGLWSHQYPRAPEIQAYIEKVVDDFAVRPLLRLNTEVKSASWNDSAKVWHLELADGTTHKANILVSALGQLDIPKWPQIAGRNTFAGPSFHSARWNWDVDLKGKRVAVIGNGGSAVQFIPEIANDVAQLDVYQRTPNYLVPRNDREVPLEERERLANNPWLLKASRELIYWRSDTLFWGVFKGSKWRVNLFENAAKKLREDQITDPALRAKLTPNYPIGCKRILICDTYYPALQRPNVNLITDPIERIEQGAIVTKDATARPSDVIIYATGFDASHFGWSVDIVGQGGAHLKDVWQDGPEAYLGVMTAGFPNFLMLYGPNTNLGHTSILYMVERQIEYALKLLAPMSETGASRLEVRADAQARFNRLIQAELKASPWATACDSWYKTETGKITNNWPRSTQDYAKALKQVEWSHYAIA